MYRYRPIESVGPTIPSTELKSNNSQLDKRQVLVPLIPQTSQRSAHSVQVDEVIDNEDSS